MALLLFKLEKYITGVMKKMGNNTKLTKERCLEAYNVAEDKDRYELLEIYTKMVVGEKRNRTRFYLKLKCNKCGNIFDSEYYGWISGRRCKRCACRKIHLAKAYDTDKVIKLFNEKGYKYISGTCNNNRDRITVEDCEGYRYDVSISDLNKHKGVFLRYLKSNPNTIYNIDHYCNINNISTTLVSDKYNSNTSKLEWQCGKSEI